MADTNPSTYEITKAIITTYDKSIQKDISATVISSFQITQSMNATSWYGSCDVLDAAGLLEGLPIRGEEYFEIWIKAFDTQTEVKLKTRIHGVTDIKPSSSSNSLTYTLNFVSESTFNASLKRLTQAYVSTVGRMVKEMFHDNFSKLSEQQSNLDPHDSSKTLPVQTNAIKILSDEYDRYLFVQPTLTRQRIIIPDLSPADAMVFVAARGYSTDSPSCTFRFFETLENYYFTTDEYFLKGVRDQDVEEFFYAPVVSMEGTNMDAQLARIEEINILSKGIDTGLDVNSGSYTNEVAEIDLVRKTFNINKFNYDKDAKFVDMDGTTRDINSNSHTKKFRDETFTSNNAKRFLLFRNYTRPGDLTSNVDNNKHISEITQNRISYYHHLNNTVLAVSLKGRLDLRPGQVIDLNLKAFKGTDSNIFEENDTLSGKYLIQSTVHKGDPEGILNTILRLAKFDWSIGRGSSENNDIPADSSAGPGGNGGV